MRRKRKLLAALAIGFAVAGLLRLLFVNEVIADWNRLDPGVRENGGVAFLNGDSDHYLSLANKLLDGSSSSLKKVINVYRPPGYPFFLALLGADPERVVLAQVVLGSLVALCAMILAYTATQSISLCIVAGLLSALSSTGIGIVAFIMADLLLAALFALGLVLLLLAARLGQSRVLVLAGAFFGLATLTKPVLLFWAPVALLVFWLFSEQKKGTFVRPASLALFLGLQLVPPLLWSAANYKRYETFTYSIIGSLTAREYWGARAEAWIEAGGSPTSEQIVEQRQRVAERIRSYELSRREKAYREETLDLLRNHPAAMAMTFAVNIGENTSSGWNRFHMQLPLRPEFAERMQPLVRLERKARECARWLIALVLLGSAVLWSFAPGLRSSKGLMVAVALSVAWLYFVVLNGITFGTGPRVLYPVQLAEIVVPLAVLHLAASAISRHRSQEIRALDARAEPTDDCDSTASASKS